MPPRAPLQTSFSVADVNNEVVCPLRNQDGSHCRKRCLGEKRYRSMQEHIRRAHPEYYIPKLPATKESFELMITTPPHELPQETSPQQQNNVHHPVVPQHSDPSGYGHILGQHDGGYYTAGDSDATAIFNSMQAQQRSSDEYRRGSLIPAASAAAALAQLQYHRGAGGEADWAGDNIGQNFYADHNHDMKPHNYHVDPTLDEPPFMQDPTSFSATTSQDQPGLLPSSLARSPTDRSNILAPLQRSHSRQHARPRTKSLTQQARMAKHERKRSRDNAKRNSGDRKAFSNEPTPAALYGKRWEDLIDAATSATEEEGSRDLTPIPASPYQSPQAASRTSVPPSAFALGSQFQSFQASPLNRALTPPPADANLDLQQYTSVDSSLSSGLSHQHHNSTDSGSQFNIMPPGAMDSNNTSPMFAPAQPVQIYCAGCRRLNALKESYACTNCICGLCGTCVEALVENQRNGRMSGCPRCSMNYGSFKQFQLDVR